jgi:hypothetical protein
VNQTAAINITVQDQSATDALKPAGNDTTNSWIQSFRNNLKSLFQSAAAETEAREDADETHAALTAPHSATPTPTANRIAMYDASGKLKSGAAPSADNEVVRKKELDDLFNLIYPVGSIYVQYPGTKTPTEMGWPGTWPVCSTKAIAYGLSTSNSGSGSIFVGRMECNNLLTASDLSVGTQITSGTYSGYYVRAVINLGGGFNGVEGGNRPAFNSGGKQGDMIRNFSGRYMQSYNNSAIDTQGASGTTSPFYVESSTHDGTGQRGPTGENYANQKAGFSFDPSRVVPTGADNAPINVSIRLFMRAS